MIQFLTIDHIDNNGGVYRKQGLHGSGDKFYSWLRRNQWPSGFQVLCWNCNIAKSVYGKCPHGTAESAAALSGAAI